MFYRILIFVVIATIYANNFADGQQQCTVPCTGEYNPVCGQQNQFSRTFSNRCQLNRENICGAEPKWEFLRVGQCP